MVLRLDDKKAIVAEVSAVASTAVSAAIADYRGLTVAKMNELRVKARESNIYLRVVRNTLARRAVQGVHDNRVRGAPEPEGARPRHKVGPRKAPGVPRAMSGTVPHRFRGGGHVLFQFGTGPPGLGR